VCHLHTGLQGIVSVYIFFQSFTCGRHTHPSPSIYRYAPVFSLYHPPMAMPA
jgi:hypothetical protein